MVAKKYQNPKGGLNGVLAVKRLHVILQLKIKRGSYGSNDEINSKRYFK